MSRPLLTVVEKVGDVVVEPLAWSVLKAVSLRAILVGIEVGLPVALSVALWGVPGLLIATIPLVVQMARRRLRKRIKDLGLLPRAYKELNDIEAFLLAIRERGE